MEQWKLEMVMERNSTVIGKVKELKGGHKQLYHE